MRLATIRVNDHEVAAVVSQTGLVPVAGLNARLKKAWATTLMGILEAGHLEEMKNWYNEGGKALLDKMAGDTIPRQDARFGPLFRHPRKIWGIGLNYVDHAGDLAEKAPTLAPASFSKFDTTIIGPGDEIKIPLQSERTTAEAELGIIFGKECKDVAIKDWRSVVAGFTTLIDVTAEDILLQNSRFLTRSKNFDTFFSFGPELVTPDEIENIGKLMVATVINGKIHAQNTVSHMTFAPDFLVSFHTEVATMLPGDIICTGTPRAVHVSHGDVVECRIDGFTPLTNPVIDLKVSR